MSRASGPEAASGGRPVGLIRDLAPLERAVVLHLRRWCSGGAEAAGVMATFSARLGPREGARLAELLHQFLSHCLGESRRRLIRHAAGCPCLGADESMLARQVALAAAGDHDAALALALGYLSGDAARQAVALSEAFGLALDRLATPPADWAALLRLPPFPPAPERTS